MLLDLSGRCIDSVKTIFILNLVNLPPFSTHSWQFQRHIKKSEGQKIPKVELQISIYGVKILDPKTKVSGDAFGVDPSEEWARLWIMNKLCLFFQDVQHNCQLHRISFCADDKTDKRIFTFICKDSESNKHLCYVFDSEKCVSVTSLFLMKDPGL